MLANGDASGNQTLSACPNAKPLSATPFPAGRGASQSTLAESARAAGVIAAGPRLGAGADSRRDIAACTLSALGRSPGSQAVQARHRSWMPCGHSSGTLRSSWAVHFSSTERQVSKHTAQA